MTQHDNDGIDNHLNKCRQFFVINTKQTKINEIRYNLIASAVTVEKYFIKSEWRVN